MHVCVFFSVCVFVDLWDGIKNNIMSSGWYRAAISWPNTCGFNCSATTYFFLPCTFQKTMIKVTVYFGVFCLMLSHSSLLLEMFKNTYYIYTSPCFCENKRIFAHQSYFMYCFIFFIFSYFTSCHTLSLYWFYFISSFLQQSFPYLYSLFLCCIWLRVAAEKLNFPTEIISFLPHLPIKLHSGPRRTVSLIRIYCTDAQ